jgi:thiol-disulfide isomerase/thioredoxin
MITFRFLTIVLITSSLLALGCNNVNNPTIKNSNSDFYSISIEKGDPTIIAGLIKNQDVYPHIKSLTLEIPDFNGYETKYTTPIEEDGSFKFVIFPISPREISLKSVSDVVVVRPGDSLFIIKDFKDIGSISFTGDAASLNSNIFKFLNGYYLGRYTQNKDNTDPDGYKQYCTNYKNEATERLKDFIEKNNPPDDFINWANTTINLDYYSALLYYLMFKKLTAKEYLEYKAEYYDFIEDIDRTFSNSIITTKHFQLSNDYYNDYLAPSIISNNESSYSRDHIRDSLFIDQIGTFSKNDNLNQFVVSNFFNGLLKTKSLDIFEENSSAITRIVREPILLNTLRERYQFVKDYATNPKPLSDAMLSNTDINKNSNEIILSNNIRKNLIQSLIANNKNKALYIDFWALWCPPCIPEMTLSKKLMENLKDDNIEFVFICLSDSVPSKEHLEQIGLGGTHYYLNPDESIYFQNNFGFQSIPHYILIDTTGVIVDFGSYLRPSNPMTIDRIKKLLK